MRSSLCAAVMAFSLLLLPSSSNANIVVNGGFETGTFSGWTQSGNTGFTSVGTGVEVHSGTYGASFGPVGSLGYLSQDLSTTAGQTYNLAFFLRNSSATANEFLVSVGGVTLFDQTNLSTFSFTEKTEQFTAAGSSTTLTFGFRNDGGFFGLDDVSVDPVRTPAVPEPAGITLFALSTLGAVPLLLTRRRRTRAA